MSKSNYTSDECTRSKRNNYRFNIAKECPICNKSFITDIFEEEEHCSACNAVFTYYEEETDKKEVLDSLNTYGWSRSAVVRYD